MSPVGYLVVLVVVTIGIGVIAYLSIRRSDRLAAEREERLVERVAKRVVSRLHEEGPQ